MAAPRVSVVLPVYNGSEFLLESITSVLTQTFEDFELLVWDDASTDGCWEIITGCADDRIVRFRQAHNRGLFTNLNDALTRARGDVVRLWSQDDRMKPGCLEREQDFLRCHAGLGFLYCQRDVIDANGRLVAHAPDDPTPAVMPGRVADDISFHWGSMPGNISTVSIPRTVLDEVGPFDTSITLAADFDLWVRIQERYPVGFCRDPLIDLRDHRAQLSRSAEAELAFCRECREIYRRLDARLPDETSAARRSYSRTVHCAQYVQAAVHAVAGGKFAYALRLLREIHQWHNVGLVVLLWMMTGNLHFYRPEPVYSEPF